MKKILPSSFDLPVGWVCPDAPHAVSAASGNAAAPPSRRRLVHPAWFWFSMERSSLGNDRLLTAVVAAHLVHGLLHRGGDGHLVAQERGLKILLDHRLDSDGVLPEGAGIGAARLGHHLT